MGDVREEGVSWEAWRREQRGVKEETEVRGRLENVYTVWYVGPDMRGLTQRNEVGIYRASGGARKGCLGK